MLQKKTPKGPKPPTDAQWQLISILRKKRGVSHAELRQMQAEAMEERDVVDFTYDVLADVIDRLK